MRFGAAQKRKFGTEDGAYSIVTNREHFDSQITLADHEAQMVISHFGQANLHIGNVGSNKKLASKSFRLFPDGKKIALNIVYPKPDKTELRLYISSRAGFKPNGGDVWFLYRQNDDIWIGAMTEPEWRIESSSLKQDDSDDIYQIAVNDNDDVRVSRLKERDTYSRDRRLAVRKMELAGYNCEYDSAHKLFISRFSRKPYLEAHHLIPIGSQSEFSKPLDIIHNIFCLCPFCHRAVHHAEESHARDILDKLASKQPILEKFDLLLADLFTMYAVEEIE